MIKSFKDKDVENIFDGKTSKKYNAIRKVAKRKLDMLHFAFTEQDLLVPPANHFEHLKGNLAGYCSIRVNDQYRVVFRFENSCAYDVQIIDYHK